MSGSDRFERIAELFRAAVDLPRDRCQEFLRGRCGNDAVMVQEVLALLARVGNEDQDSFLLHARDAARRDEDRGSLPDRIGPYHPLELLGEGGMGTVYLAEQRLPVRRRVALKVIKLGMDSRAVLARFDAERQALSMMEHGAVARIFDAGITDEGRPYFAMEHVKGVPITDYCDQNRLSLEARIDLFRQVCSGVQHAHLKGVMHRDLKPGNVLVTVQDGKPVPKIIDFGLAKAMEHRLVEATLFTGHGQVLGTPEYMSPEQAGLGGLDVDTRTDVYSLGVLLYELLTGYLPFARNDLLQQGYAEMQRILRETDPQKPSTRVTTLGDVATETARRRSIELVDLRRRLRGDLDWIVMKALEKDRTRRYETAMELAADLDRHVRDLPVMASPPSAGYRLRKYVRRHRPMVVAITVAALALVSGSVAALAGMVEAKEQTAIARTEQQRADRHAEESRQLLVKYNLLNGLELVLQLLERETDLYPAVPTRAVEMQRWLDDCGEALAMRADLERGKAEIEAGAEAAALTGLIRALRPLDQHMTRLAAVRTGVAERLAWARSIEQLTLHGGRLTWSAARTAIAASASYRSAPIPDLKPQLGLVPLGENPATGLWEFYELRSAWDAATGIEPARLPLPEFDRRDGSIRMDASSGIVYVLVPGATYAMGVAESDEPKAYETPQLTVTIAPFLLSRFELTQAQWRRWSGGGNPSTYSPEHPNGDVESEGNPVESVTWKECDLLLRRNSATLPTEAQWEWACRAGTHTRWWTGDTAESLAGAANILDAQTVARGRWQGNPAPFADDYQVHAPVGSFRGNAFGLHDMHGNVWEWCQDAFCPYDDPSAPPRPGDGLRQPQPSPHERRVIRGGGFNDGPDRARATYRWIADPTFKANILGVRPARALER